MRVDASPRRAWLHRAAAAYGILLVVLPAEIRTRYREQLRAAFYDAGAEALERGGLAAMFAILWLIIINLHRR